MASAFPELDLSGISMDAPEPVTPARVVATDDDVVLESQPSLVADGGVILAQPAISPLASVSKPFDPIADGAPLQEGGDIPADVLDM